MMRALKILCAGVLALTSTSAFSEGEDVAIMMLQASQKVVEHQYDDAITLYTQAIAKAPTYADLYLQRAFTYREMNRIGQMQADAIVVVKLADQKITGGSNNGRDYYLRGSGYRLLKRFPEARADIENAIRMKNDNRWRMDLQALSLEEKMQ